MANQEIDPEVEFEHEPSQLDEMSHNELGLVYNDATRTIIFAKGIQWRAVASTMIIFFVLGAAPHIVPITEDFTSLLKIGVIIFAMAAVFMLIVFQLWQHTEGQKIAAIELQYSNTFRMVRRKKWKLEADIHRYAILILMTASILFTAFLAIEVINLHKPNGP